MASDWKERLRAELFDLTERREKLGQFIDGTAYDELEVEDRSLLGKQYHAMGEYADILSARVQRLPT